MMGILALILANASAGMRPNQGIGQGMYEGMGPPSNPPMRRQGEPVEPSSAEAAGGTATSRPQAMTGDASTGLQQLKDPSLNLRLGARYLRLQVDRFGGDLRLVLAAYNAGPGAARRWVDLDPDPDYFVEKIGFAETRAYIRRVLGSYGVYKLLW